VPLCIPTTSLTGMAQRGFRIGRIGGCDKRRVAVLLGVVVTSMVGMTSSMP
jgi:hypothetical protein